MKFEHAFGLLFGSVLISTIAVFAWLFEKYTTLTVFNFAQSCTQTIGGFLSSPYHWAGLSILSLVVILSTVFGLKIVFSAFKTQLKMRSFVRVRLNRLPSILLQFSREYQLKPSQVIVVKNTQPVAFTMGIFQTKIVVSTGLLKLLTHQELEAVMLHELYHLRHHHPGLLLSADIIASTLSFLPSLFDVLAQMKAHLEHAADAHARSVQKTEHHLVTAIEQVMNFEQPQAFSPAFALTVVEQRLHALHHHHYQPQPISKSRGLLTAMSLVIVGVLLAIPAQTQASTEGGLAVSIANCGDGLLCSIRCRTLEPNHSSNASQEVPSESTLESPTPELKLSPGFNVELNHSESTQSAR